MRTACRQLSLEYRRLWISQGRRTRFQNPELLAISIACRQRFFLLVQDGKGKRQHVPHASIILIELYGTISASCLRICPDLFVTKALSWIRRYCKQSAPVVKPHITSILDLPSRTPKSWKSRSKDSGKCCFCIYEPDPYTPPLPTSRLSAPVCHAICW